MKNWTKFSRHSLPVLGVLLASVTQGQADQLVRASFYGKELAGNRTASGERFNPAGLTAAHKTLPLGTRLRLTNVANGRSVVVRVNDRGPFVRGRALDVSHGAARALGFVAQGTAALRMQPVGREVAALPTRRADMPASVSEQVSAEAAEPTSPALFGATLLVETTVR